MKIFTGIAAAAAAAMMLTAQGYAAQKTVTVNVAQGKAVTTNVVLTEDAQQFDEKNLVDGDINTMSLMLGMADNEYYIIDLAGEYDITGVELYDRQDQLQKEPEARMGFEIQVSDSADFSEYEKIGGLDTQDDDAFPPRGCYRIEDTSANKYRYVRLVRTQKHPYWWLFFSELKVFAEVEETVNVDMSGVDMTKISDGADAFASDWYDKANDPLAENGLAPKNLLDDEISNNNRWLSYYGERADEIGYTYLIIDLHKPRTVDYIELEAVKGSGTDIANFYSNFSLYLANEYDGEVLFNNRTLSGRGEYKQIAAVGDNADTLWIDGKYTVKCSSAEKYRYLIYKRTSGRPEKTCFSELGAVRIYELNPMVEKMSLDRNEIVLEFSEEMDAATLTAENIVIYAGDTPLEYVGSAGGKRYTATLPAQVFDTEITAVVSPDVKSARGVALKGEVRKTLKAPAAVTAVQPVFSSEGGSVTSLAGLRELTADLSVSNNRADAEESAAVLLVLYDADNCIADTDETVCKIAPGATLPVRLTVPLPDDTAGYRARVFIWRSMGNMGVIEKSVGIE